MFNGRELTSGLDFTVDTLGNSISLIASSIDQLAQNGDDWLVTVAVFKYHDGNSQYEERLSGTSKIISTSRLIDTSGDAPTNQVIDVRPEDLLTVDLTFHGAVERHINNHETYNDDYENDLIHVCLLYTSPSARD